jgi:hypothetical protein
VAVRRGCLGILIGFTAFASGDLAADPTLPDSSSPGNPTASAETTCSPALATLSPPKPPRTRTPEAAYDPLRGWNPELNLGVGHLASTTDFAADWAVRIRLPLFASAGSTPSHWIVNGWRIPHEGDEAPQPFGLTGLVEVGYEVPAFIVHEEREDGWLRLRFGPAATELAWTHRCFFEQSSGPLRVQRWDARFTSDEISPLYFRAQVPHALRAEPDPQAQRVRRIPAREGDYILAPVAIRGDWMQVEVREPSDYCGEPETVVKTVGWVQWRDAERGPWVWYYTRGC